MINKDQHIIRRVSLELRKTQKDGALALQSVLTDLFWKELVPEMNAIFSKLIDPDKLIRIEQLEIDLGTIDERNLKQELKKRLLEALKTELEKIQSSSSAKAEIVAFSISHFERWLFFLENGFLSWSTTTAINSGDSQNAVLGEVASRSASTQRLVRLLQNDASALKRLVLQFPDAFIQQLLVAITARPLSHLPEILLLLIEVLPIIAKQKSGLFNTRTEGAIRKRQVRLLFWELIIISVVTSSTPPDEEELILVFFSLISARPALLISELSTSLEHYESKNGSSPALRFFKQIVSRGKKMYRLASIDQLPQAEAENLGKAKRSEVEKGNQPNELLEDSTVSNATDDTSVKTTTEDSQTYKESESDEEERLQQEDKNATPKNAIEREIATKENLSSNEISSDKPEEESKMKEADDESPDKGKQETLEDPFVSTEKKTTQLDIDASIQSPKEDKTQAKQPKDKIEEDREEKLKQGPKHDSEESLQEIVEEKRDAIEEQKQAEHTEHSHSAEANKKDNSTEEVDKKEEDIQERFRKVKESIKKVQLKSTSTTANKGKAIKTGTFIYLEGAGLAILHPFLSTFFRELKLVEKDDFVDETARERAVQLLNLLVFGKEEIAEHQMVLAKILCEMPLDTPVPMLVSYSDTEQDEADHLLKAVVKHWGALGNTSPDGLKEGFLQREGRLERKENGWYLTVKRETIDILVDRLPWGRGMIQLPWMEEMLRVEW